MTPDPRGTESDALAEPQVAGSGPNRRQVLALAGGSAAALGLAVGPFSGFFAGAADGSVPPEIQLAGWLTGLELAAVTLYETLATEAGFDDATRQLASTCVAHHDAHNTSLAQMVSGGGGTTATAANQAFVDEFTLRLDGAADGAAKATVLAEMEEGFAATYQAALATVTRASLAAVVAQILATDATHAVAWSAAANGQGSENPLPTPEAVPASQTDEGAFTEATFAPNPTTEEGEEGEGGEAGGEDAAPDTSPAETTTGDAS